MSLRTPLRASAAGFSFALHTVLQSVAFAAMRGHDAASQKTYREVCMSDSNGGDSNNKKPNLSRRSMFGAMAGAAAAVPLLAQAQQPAQPAAQGAPPAGRGGRGGGRGNPQGGAGRIRVLFMSSYHPFDRENLFVTLDSFGQDINWTHVEHPAAEKFYDPRLAADYDVILSYDAFAGRAAPPTGGSRIGGTDTPPSAQTQANLKALMQAGTTGFVFFHHALSSWAHTWPAGVNGTNAYIEMMGGVADWGKELRNVRGRTYPPSGFKPKTPQRVSIVDRNHPITAGLEDFDIVDEAYLCPMFEDSVHPLLRTNFKPTASAFTPGQAGHPDGSNMTAWVKTAERSPVVYIQHGHDNEAWTNASFRRLMLNAIKWAASPESKTWARANEKRIFV